MATPAEVWELLVDHLAAVMAVDARQVSSDTRFDEDLHADSLDVVEVIERVERELRARGEAAHISDEDLLGLRTVGEAAERIAAVTVAEAETR